ncbi:MAG TPA: hypothetical protein PLF40_16770, partial [Kofleriaceae bacterium]|nr:hypothetical protein [Kofleriaceae bacterium]
MRPPSFVQWPVRSDARAAYLAALYADTATLPSVFASVKLWLLSHLLVEELRHNRRHEQLFLEFMDQRNAELRLDQQRSDDGTRRSMINQAAEALGLPVQADVDIVDLYLQAYVRATGAVPPAVAARIEQTWLARYVAEQRLLLGKSTNDNDARVLGASAVAALAARTELELCAHNPTSFAATAPVALDVDIKNIDRVTVKVYRIDPIAYFAATGRAVGIELDLDGITASYEDSMTLAVPQIQRTRHTFTLPSCARPGTYIVEVIGGGIASRTLLNKGRLRCLARPSAAGTVVAVFDSEAAGADIRPLAGAKLWLAGLELVADATHEIVVPLSVANQTQTALVVAGDVATVLELPRFAENIELQAAIVAAQEHLAAGKRVRAVADVTLQIAGVSASLALLRNARWELTLRAVDGTVTTKAEPLTLIDGNSAVLEWKLPDDITAIDIAITATCDRQTDRSAMHLRTTSTIAMALPPHGNAPDSDPVHELFLLRHVRGLAIACLGRNGEPAANRPVELVLQHRYSSETVDVTLQTDAQGRVELGEIGELVGISATVGEVARVWTLPQPQLAVASRAGIAGTSIVLPVLTSAFDAATFAAQLPYAALVERRGGAVVRHITEPATWRDGAIVLPALAAGDYQFVLPGIATVELTVLPANALVYGEFIGALDTTLQQPELPPRIASVAWQGRRLRIDLCDVDPSTALHVIVTQFAVATTASAATPLAQVLTERVAPLQSYVINGRDVGDEVRYVFDRKHAPRRPSPLLDKPTLLANPWARQATVTTTMAAAPGMPMPREAPAPAMYAMRKMAKEAYGGDADSLTNYGFVTSSMGSVFANVTLQATGADAGLAWAEVDLAEAPGAAVRIVVSDRRGAVEHDVYLAAQPLQIRDLRLSLAIAPERHVAERRKIDVTAVGQPLVVRDAATAKVRVVETVEKLFGYLSALRSDSGLAEFAFMTTWHSQSQAAKLDLYHRFACHELHLFLYFKDAAFFASVVMPLLRTKRRKTFIDAWLLHLPLADYAAPSMFAQLNACERALLAHRVPNRDGIVRALGDDILAGGKDASEPRRVAAMLLGAAMDDDDALASLQQNAIAQREAARGPFGGAALGASRSEMKAELYEEEATGEHASFDLADEADDERSAPKKRAAKSAPARSMGPGAPRDLDRARRAQPAEPVFAVLDKTQEWAESNWWHARPAQNSTLIAPNAFWRAVASCPSDALRQFISTDVGLCTDSLAAVLCALALTDLPFTAAAPSYTEQQGDIAVTTTAPALLASAQLLDSSVADPAAVVLVQNYLQAAQRTEWVDGESREVYVVGDLTVGVPYVMQVVVSNASAQAVRGEVLMQIPRGAITLTAGGATLRPQLDLPPYTTTTFEGVFYFPAVGEWTHFPAHATANGGVLGAAEARTLRVVPRNDVVSSENWDDLANRVALPVLLEYLRTRPLGPNQQLDALAWRLREGAGYNAIVTVLEQRCRFDETLWGYALAHGDEARGLQLLR